MNNSNSNSMKTRLLTTAVAGLLTAGVTMAKVTPAFAEGAEAPKHEANSCKGANGCKGKAEGHEAKDKASCKGSCKSKNGCKGKKAHAAKKKAAAPEAEAPKHE